MKKPPGSRKLDGFALGVLLALAAYTALAWSPSSYALVFERLGGERVGLVAGEPREIREDEWVRWTPFLQAAVRNGFRTPNETSLYREDLRNAEGLPLADWGLILKPYFWGFFLLDPAHGFSLYHAFWIGACLLGWERLFRALGQARPEAVSASLALFGTSFTQIWWTTYGPIVAGLPWIVLACLAPMGPALRVLVTAYAIASWSLASLHPPIVVTLAFVAGVAVLASRRDALAPRRLLPFAAGAALGIGLVVTYYGEVFTEMAGTVYPGGRRSGGGGAPFAQWLSHFLPGLVIDGERAVVNENVCEAATVGSFLPLLLLCFVDARDLVRRLGAPGDEGRRLRLELGVLLAGAAATSLWLLAPIPAALGMPLLWHVVPAKRMWLACGLLIFLLALAVLRHARLRPTWPRAAVSAALVLAAEAASRGLGARELGWGASSAGLLVAVGAWLALRGRTRLAPGKALVGSAAVANLIAFAGFNPIQSARPIFDPPELPARAALARLAERHPRRWLVLSGSHGAWLNGLGYASAAHVLFAPRLEFFRGLYPTLAEDRFQWLFNRSLYVSPVPGRGPELVDESLIQLSIELFDPPTIPVRLGPLPSDVAAQGGAVEHGLVYEEDGGVRLSIEGWALMDGSDPDSTLRVYTTLPVAAAVAYPVLRGDVARKQADPGLALSGFDLRLELVTPAKDLKQPLPDLLEEPICIVSESPARGRFRIRGGSGTCVWR
jgi:hypothetical protein